MTFLYDASWFYSPVNYSIITAGQITFSQSQHHVSKVKPSLDDWLTPWLILHPGCFIEGWDGTGVVVMSLHDWLQWPGQTWCHAECHGDCHMSRTLSSTPWRSDSGARCLGLVLVCGIRFEIRPWASFLHNLAALRCYVIGTPCMVSCRYRQIYQKEGSIQEYFLTLGWHNTTCLNQSATTQQSSLQGKPEVLEPLIPSISYLISHKLKSFLSSVHVLLVRL